MMIIGVGTAATAAPMPVAPSAIGLSPSAQLTHMTAGMERREARRGERRVHRYERRSERYAHRYERRAIRHGNY
jgi:hypothetical protein